QLEYSQVPRFSESVAFTWHSPRARSSPPAKPSPLRGHGSDRCRSCPHSVSRRQHYHYRSPQRGDNMNRIKYAAAIAMAVGCTVALSAQAVSGDKDKAAQTRMSSPVTVTGCIAKGPEAGHYVLTNAVLTPETAPSAAGATSASTIDKTASIPAGTSYALKGDRPEGTAGPKVEWAGTPV